MTLIEGVGDEVIQFLGVTLVFIVGTLAWWSTSNRPSRYRTVVIMRRRTSSSAATPGVIREDTVADSASESNDTDESDQEVPVQEMDSIVDADMALMDNNRLHFYRRIDTSENAAETPAPALESRPRRRRSTRTRPIVTSEGPSENAQMREMNNIVNAMEAEIASDCDFFREVREANHRRVLNPPPIINASDPNDTEDRTIHIKLKYLNDTSKEVEGTMNELLKDFKLRHFSRELNSQQRVRLIFRGRVLSDDTATLRSLGLHDRAVLHCLVHGPRTPVPVVEEPVIRPEVPAERPWDLENVLMTLVSVALTVVWLFRCEYSNMFTASASVALFGLTAFYSVAVFGLYLSDTFHFAQRQAPAHPLPIN